MTAVKFPVDVGKHISTHTLRKEGDLRRRDQRHAGHRISTHTLRKEGDNPEIPLVADDPVFQPTPSARRVTIIRNHDKYVLDKFQPTPSARRVTFMQRMNIYAEMVFQPTPSARRVTL